MGKGLKGLMVRQHPARRVATLRMNTLGTSVLGDGGAYTIGGRSTMNASALTIDPDLPMTELAFIELLRAELGAVVELDLHPIPDVGSPAEHARNRARIGASVKACAACGLRAGCTSPVAFDGPRAPKFAALGEAPGSQEDKLGRPFTGPSGKLLKALLSSCGMPSDDVLFLNVVSCWPKVGDEMKRGGAKSRQPTDVEMKACRRNLLQQLEVANTRYVLLVGGTALRAFRDDLKVSDVHGRVFLWMDRYVVMPVYHPSALLRERGSQRPMRDGTVEDLKKWALVVNEEAHPYDFLDGMCSRCRREFADHVDPDGVGYCEAHWGRWGGNWKQARKKWAVKEPESQRMELF